MDINECRFTWFGGYRLETVFANTSISANVVETSSSNTTRHISSAQKLDLCGWLKGLVAASVKNNCNEAIYCNHHSWKPRGTFRKFRLIKVTIGPRKGYFTSKMKTGIGEHVLIWTLWWNNHCDPTTRWDAALPRNFLVITFAGAYLHFDKSELSKSAFRFSTTVMTPDKGQHIFDEMR